MCSIIGSFSKTKIKELIELNQYRGNFSYSISLLDINTNKIVEQVKEFGSFNYDILDKCYTSKEIYYICHVQSPTSGLIRDYSRIHPTNIKESFLWHNGIITPKGMIYLQEHDYNKNTSFDTLALNQQLYNRQFKELNYIEGLFSCLYLDTDIYMFRSKHGKLYIDKDLNISSERFINSKCINYDTIYKVNFKEKNIIIHNTFKTKKFNIIVKGEL